MSTQKHELLQYLLKYGRITTLEAIEKLNNTRLAARILDLRNDGWIIPGEMVKVGKKRVMQYRTPTRA